MNFERELEVCLNLVSSLRDDILKIYNSDDFGTEIKEDNSPVTKVDKLVDKKIREVLSQEFPNFSFLTEESVDDLSRLKNDFVFIVDPIDGTKDFLLKNGEFTVNIGISYKHKAVMGVIYVPATDETYFALEGKGSFYKKTSDSKPVQIHTSDRETNLRVLTSRCHFNEFEQSTIDKYKDRFESINAVGASLKGCLIAKGDADYHIRQSSNTKEWDTCAMQVVVEQAGGHLLRFDGKPIVYNREDVYNRDGYIICNRIENYLL